MIRVLFFLCVCTFESVLASFLGRVQDGQSVLLTQGVDAATSVWCLPVLTRQVQLQVPFQEPSSDARSQ